MTKKNFSKNNSPILKEDDILYFLHIPKTGGLTMIYILNGFFDYSSILTEHSWDQLLPQIPKNFSDYRFVRGHFGYGFYRQFPKKPIYITMLRDPIEQSISNLEMLRRLPKERLKYNISEKTNFEDLIESKIPFNLQTLFLAVDVDFVESIKTIDLKNLSDFNFHHLKEYAQPSISHQKMIEIAKKNLSEFSFVGITEKFDESVLLLCYTFDWIPIRSKIKINVSKNRLRQKDLSKKSIDMIKEKTNLDSELYDYGNLLFEQRYIEMVNELKDKYFEERFSKLPQTNMIYEMLKKRYIKKHGRTKFFKEYFKFNFHKIDFVIRFGFKTRIKQRIFK